MFDGFGSVEDCPSPKSQLYVKFPVPPEDVFEKSTLLGGKQFTRVPGICSWCIVVGFNHIIERKGVTSVGVRVK